MHDAASHFHDFFFKEIVNRGLTRISLKIKGYFAELTIQKKHLCVLNQTACRRMKPDKFKKKYGLTELLRRVDVFQCVSVDVDCNDVGGAVGHAGVQTGHCWIQTKKTLSDTCVGKAIFGRGGGAQAG